MNLSKFKKCFKFLSNTPLHPQWLITRHANKNNTDVASLIKEDVLDVGSAEQSIKNYLAKDIKYIGLDYYSTAKDWYACVPDVYGDAKALPIKSNYVSTVLMMDVLEHLPYPEKCINEIDRVLKPGGRLIVQTPFIYPLHDQPLDFCRLTEYGYEKLLERTNLNIESINRVGKPIETAGLMLNLALCKTLFDSIEQKKLVAVLLLSTPLVVPIVNIVCWILTPFCPIDNFMPLNYRVVAKKE